MHSPALLQAAQPDRAQIIALSEACQAVGTQLYALSPTPEATALRHNSAPLYGIDEEAAIGTANAALKQPTQIYTQLDDQRFQVGGQACIVFTDTLTPA